MKKSVKYRMLVPEVRRVIVKIGSRVLVQRTGRPDVRRMKSLATEIAGLQKKGYEVVIVTSGAIGAGMEALGMKERPTALPDLQMAAAVGQCRLMSRYDALFSKLGCKVGQILLTHGDLHHNVRMANARRTMENLIRHKVIPIINENDAVADEEIKADLALGDNDLLSSLLVRVIRADLLIMLTTVDGLREFLPGGKSRRIPYIEKVDKEAYKLVNKSHSALSKGGMDSKLRAAKSVTDTGCLAIIANGRQNRILTDILAGRDTGTLVLPSAV